MFLPFSRLLFWNLAIFLECRLMVYIIVFDSCTTDIECGWLPSLSHMVLFLLSLCKFSSFRPFYSPLVFVICILGQLLFTFFLKFLWLKFLLERTITCNCTITVFRIIRPFASLWLLILREVWIICYLRMHIRQLVGSFAFLVAFVSNDVSVRANNCAYVKYFIKILLSLGSKWDSFLSHRQLLSFTCLNCFLLIFSINSALFCVCCAQIVKSIKLNFFCNKFPCCTVFNTIVMSLLNKLLNLHVKVIIFFTALSNV